MTDKYGVSLTIGDYVTYWAARKNRTINKSAGESAEVVSIGKKKIGIKLNNLSPFRIYVDPKNCSKTAPYAPYNGQYKHYSFGSMKTLMQFPATVKVPPF